ncbi:hypothetical protein GOODEAATRI_014457 [Goodea atripinnis]|uniref:Uncharacterized protein n=1 Tax=Goodea atripinnis TaxID=208336 RepID=A0ABV0MS11_9TELE
MMALSSALAQFNRSEPVKLLGDLIWDMLNPPENVLLFDSLNLHQIVFQPTYDPKISNKASLIDLILTNSLHMYSTGPFCSDFSDLCCIACIHKGHFIKLPWEA